MFRYLDFHLDHSNGRIFQYVNEHVNAYEQVLLCIFFLLLALRLILIIFQRKDVFHVNAYEQVSLCTISIL